MHNIAKLGPAATGQIFRLFVRASTLDRNGAPNCDAMALRKKTLEELKEEAIAEPERRGYAVRGKTPAQIRQILRRRHTNQN
jgi:hypothetical protein